MATLSEMIILSWWLLFIAPQFPHLFVYISPNIIIMTEQKGKGYKVTRETETFEYENTRSDFKYCYY